MIPVSLENGTEAVLRAWRAAQDVACDEGAAEVEPCHLFRALLQDPEARPALLLTASGLDLGAWQAPPPPVVRPGKATTPPAPSRITDSALQAARHLASELSGVRAVSTQHVLLALIRADGGLRDDLRAKGLDMTRLEEAMRRPADEPLVPDCPLRLEASGDEIASARLMDAAANRAREALRVAEDYCRFALADRYLTEELKQLRHRLTALLAHLPERLGLEARDTLADVGTDLRVDAEMERSSAEDVARVSFKRLGEALRSLEEFGKLCRPNVGADVQDIRYRAYSLERAVVPGTQRRRRLGAAQLCVLVTGSHCPASLDWTVAEAVSGGAQIIQLREKGLSDRALLERARQLRRWTRKAGAVFVVNDRPDIARLAEADGVHLGQDDLPVHEARRILGPGALVGVSTHAIDQVRRAVLDGADYLGVGPVFPSGTKDFAARPGVAFAAAAVAETSLPAFAIGGVMPENLPQLLAVGVRRVAVCAAVCGSADPRLAASTLRRMLDRHPG